MILKAFFEKSSNFFSEFKDSSPFKSKTHFCILFIQTHYKQWKLLSNYAHELWKMRIYIFSSTPLALLWLISSLSSSSSTSTDRTLSSSGHFQPQATATANSGSSSLLNDNDLFGIEFDRIRQRNEQQQSAAAATATTIAPTAVYAHTQRALPVPPPPPPLPPPLPTMTTSGPSSSTKSGLFDCFLPSKKCTTTFLVADRVAIYRRIASSWVERYDMSEWWRK